MTTDSGKARAWTPGPWKMDRNNCHAGEIATVHGCRGGWIEIWSTSWPMDEDSQEANARLMAAAPALFEALDRLLNVDAENLADVIAAEDQARVALASAQEPQP